MNIKAMQETLQGLKARQAALEANGRQIDHALDCRIADLEDAIEAAEADWWARRTPAGGEA